VEDINALKRKFTTLINEARTPEALEAARIAALGRKGEVTQLLRTLGELPLEKRRTEGPKLQALKQELTAAFEARRGAVADSSGAVRRFDVTKPGIKRARGHLHPLTHIDLEVRRIFSAMNFQIVDGPEVESEYYNFDALNIPSHHPARDLWDTFWLKPPVAKGAGQDGAGAKRRMLLRTHTSPVQIRFMEAHHPPFQIIVPGRVFRYEATDASHAANFYQVEGLMVGPEVTLANFRYLVEEFFRELFRGQKISFRFRPSFFPFVEPGLEVDIQIGKGKWLEVMGAGMVHRNVFDAVRYNPDKIRGFAFGVGLDRLAMIKYGVPDIRFFYSGDLRFVRQF
jgi:phenylalanyl-tRNA synthetase alpha chain